LRLEQLIRERRHGATGAIAETIDVIAVLSGRGVDRRLAELAFVEGVKPDGDYLIRLEGDRP
jgi:type IV secretion system protein VirB11